MEKKGLLSEVFLLVVISVHGTALQYGFYLLKRKKNEFLDCEWIRPMGIKGGTVWTRMFFHSSMDRVSETQTTNVRCGCCVSELGVRHVVDPKGNWTTRCHPTGDPVEAERKTASEDWKAG